MKYYLGKVKRSIGGWWYIVDESANLSDFMYLHRDGVWRVLSWNGHDLVREDTIWFFSEVDAQNALIRYNTQVFFKYMIDDIFGAITKQAPVVTQQQKDNSQKRSFHNFFTSPTVENVRIFYLRDKKRRPNGVVMSWKDTKTREYQLGWSKCHKDDRWNRYVGLNQAINNTVRLKDLGNLSVTDKIPHDVWKALMYRVEHLDSTNDGLIPTGGL